MISHSQNILTYKKEISNITLLFIVSRIIAIKAGVYTHDLDWLTQTFDISLMQKGLLKNVFYDFYQAPFLNLSIGLFVKFFGSKWQTAMSIFYTVLSFAIIVQVYLVLIYLNINKKIAYYSTIFLLVLNPALIYYERYVIYHTPVAFLLVNAVLFFRTEKNIPTFLSLFLTSSYCFLSDFFHPLLVYWYCCCCFTFNPII